MCHGWPKVYFLLICNNGYVTEEIELKLRTIEYLKKISPAAPFYSYYYYYNYLLLTYAFVDQHNIIFRGCIYLLKILNLHIKSMSHMSLYHMHAHRYVHACLDLVTMIKI